MIDFFGPCHPLSNGLPTRQGLELLRDICGEPASMRFGIGLEKVFTGITFNEGDTNEINSGHVYEALQRHMLEGIDAVTERCNAAGVKLVGNLVNCPPWASQGVPAYQPMVGGSPAWWLFRQMNIAPDGVVAVFKAIRTALLDTPLLPQNDPDAFLALCGRVLFDVIGAAPAPSNVWHFGMEYIKEQAQTGSWDDPLNESSPSPPGGSWHVCGDPRFTEIDKMTAYRPWCERLDACPAPEMAAYLSFGRIIGSRYGGKWAAVSLLNEPDGRGFFLPIGFDGANVPGGPDVIPTHLAPMVEAFFSGVLDQAPQLEVWGLDYAGSDMMRRCAGLSILFEAITYHIYDESGVSIKNALARCRNELWPMLDRVRNPRQKEIIGETGDSDPHRLIAFLRDVMNERPQTAGIFLLESSYFVDGFTTENPKKSRWAGDLKTLIKDFA